MEKPLENLGSERDIDRPAGTQKRERERENVMMVFAILYIDDGNAIFITYIKKLR